MTVFLDTDVMIDLFREHSPAVAWIETLDETEIILSGFVAMELIQGCRDKVQQDKIERVILRYRVLWPLPDVCEQAFKLFCTYRLSHQLGILDAIIAQQAISFLYVQ